MLAHSWYLSPQSGLSLISASLHDSGRDMKTSPGIVLQAYIDLKELGHYNLSQIEIVLHGEDCRLISPKLIELTMDMTMSASVEQIRLPGKHPTSLFPNWAVTYLKVNCQWRDEGLLTPKIDFT